MRHVMVIDLETTGLRGFYEGNKILSVGIAHADLEARTIRPIFYTAIRQKLTDAEKYCWLFSNGHMTPEEIESAPFNESQTANIIIAILKGQAVTSYNTEFDLDLFLYPWLAYNADNLPIKGIERAPCIMKAADRIKDIPRQQRLDGTAYPSLAASFGTLVEDRRKMHAHNALDDAIMAGQVLLKLHGMGAYDPNRRVE